jgi:hypothetical protein
LHANGEQRAGTPSAAEQFLLGTMQGGVRALRATALEPFSTKLLFGWAASLARGSALLNRHGFETGRIHLIPCFVEILPQSLSPPKTAGN